MPLFWLAYRQKGIACVLILQASSLISARLKATLQIDGIDEHFAKRFELERELDVPAGMVGRLLNQEEAEALLKKLEHQIPKKATAASMKRTAKTKKAPAARATRAR
jgi:hypothetical protein